MKLPHQKLYTGKSPLIRRLSKLENMTYRDVHHDAYKNIMVHIMMRIRMHDVGFEFNFLLFFLVCGSFFRVSPTRKLNQKTTIRNRSH
jgi:hypothetical protein